MKKEDSKIPFSYKTIRVTQSRLDKGLLAIPVSLIDSFPKNKTKVTVIMGLTGKVTTKNFTAYTSTSRECRIGGMRGFYEKFNVKDGDELVIQILDDKEYRIIPEKDFENSVWKLESEFDKSKNDNEAESKLIEVSKVTNSDLTNTTLNEYYRLSTAVLEKRKYSKPGLSKSREIVPASIRKLLEKIYEGKCQISGFSFLMRNGNQYFELHHINPELGNHIKNLLVVSPNVHAQFTYALVEELFDSDGWLRRVKFNGQSYKVKLFIDKFPMKFKKEIHFEV